MLTVERHNAHVLSNLGAGRVPFSPKVRVTRKLKQKQNLFVKIENVFDQIAKYVCANAICFDEPWYQSCPVFNFIIPSDTLRAEGKGGPRLEQLKTVKDHSKKYFLSF